MTIIPPGFTVSWRSSDATPSTSRTTVTLCPDASRPEDGETFSLPIGPGDSVMDHDTGPPEAVRVRLLSRSGVSTIVVGVTLNVPGPGGGVAVAVLVAEAVLLAVAVLVDGAGAPGDVL